MKKLVVSIIIAGIGIVLAFWLLTRPPDFEPPTAWSAASWTSAALTVAQVKQEADLVVRVRVASAPVPRVVRSEVPRIELRNGAQIQVATRVAETVFSDTTFEILQVYQGTAPSTLTVMQTGGSTPRNPLAIAQTRDDPLYKIGEEYILFLVNISDDPVQAPGRSLYRVVNPAGRYRIQGQSVRSYTTTAILNAERNAEATTLPTTVSELEAQIR